MGLDTDSDLIREAIGKIVEAAGHESHMIGSVTLIAEMVSPNGENFLFHLDSSDLSVWKERGMLMYRLDMLSGQATVTEIGREND